jgi:hypothetical protein
VRSQQRRAERAEAEVEKLKTVYLAAQKAVEVLEGERDALNGALRYHQGMYQSAKVNLEEDEGEDG